MGADANSNTVTSEDLRTREAVPAPRYETIAALLQGICSKLPAVEAHRIDLT